MCIWQATRVLLCDSGELLHNARQQTKGLLYESNGVGQLLHNTGLPQTKGLLCVMEWNSCYIIQHSLKQRSLCNSRLVSELLMTTDVHVCAQLKVHEL